MFAGPFLNKGRNITCDYFFTSAELPKKEKAKKTSIVGTVNRIRRGVPRIIKNMKEPLYFSIIVKSNDITLTIYQGKPSKNVLILSTMHRTVAIKKEKKKLTESVIY